MNGLHGHSWSTRSRLPRRPLADNACSFHNIIRYSGGSYDPYNGTDPGGTQIASYNIGGTYDCSAGSSIAWTFPSLNQEAFVITSAGAVYTIWDSASGLSSWVEFGGSCELGSLHVGYYGTVNSNGSGTFDGWTMGISCVAPNGSGTWYKYRYDTANGSWSGWTQQDIMTTTR